MAARTRSCHDASSGAYPETMVLGLRTMHEVVDRCASPANWLGGWARLQEFTATVRRVRAAVLWIVLVALITVGVSPAAAQNQNIGHFGKNRLKFAPVEPFLLPDATGTGIVDYKGGKEPSSQWRASFRFTGLEPGASYTVVIRGRFGARGLPGSEMPSPRCAHSRPTMRGRVAASGISAAWRGSISCSCVTGNENGTPVLEANRSRGPGSIETEPNRFSPGGEIPARKKLIERQTFPADVSDAETGMNQAGKEGRAAIAGGNEPPSTRSDVGTALPVAGSAVRATPT